MRRGGVAGIRDWLDVYADLGRDECIRLLLERAKAVVDEDPAVTADQVAEPGSRSAQRDETMASGTSGGGGEYDPNEPYSPSDLHIARRLLMELFAPPTRRRGRWGLARWEGRWWVYVHSHRVWRTVEEDRLVQVILAHLAGKWIKTGKSAEPFNATARRVVSVIRAMETDTAVDGLLMPMWLPATHGEDGAPTWDEGRRLIKSVVDGAPDPACLVSCEDGIVDASAWREGWVGVRRMPPSERYFARSHYPWRLDAGRFAAACRDGEDAEQWYGEICPRWAGFVRACAMEDPGWERCLRQWFGYCLIAANWLEKALVMIGPPAAGKSTIVRVLMYMLGRDACVTTSINRISERWETARLVGRNLVVMADAHLGRTVDTGGLVETLNVLIDKESTHRCEVKNRPEIPDVMLQCKVVMSANEMMRVHDPSGSLARRLVWLPFRVGHEGNEDRGLLPALRGELPGIWQWAMVGLWDLMSSGRLCVSEGGATLTEDFRALSSLVRAFVRECCEVDPEAWVLTREVYGAYVAWCKEQGGGLNARSQEAFGAELRACVIGLTRTQRREGGERHWTYKGLRVVHNPAVTRTLYGEDASVV